MIKNLDRSKKSKLSRARMRVNKHILERQKFIREYRTHIKDREATSGKFKKIIYGYPWWPWFK